MDSSFDVHIKIDNLSLFSSVIQLRIISISIPSIQAFGLHAHEEEGDEHAEEEGAEELTIIWRSCVVILGLYLFFVFEFVLHTWSVHSHSLSSSRSNSKSDVSTLGEPLSLETGLVKYYRDPIQY